VGSLTSHNPIGLHGLLWDSFTLLLLLLLRIRAVAGRTSVTKNGTYKQNLFKIKRCCTKKSEEVKKKKERKNMPIERREEIKKGIRRRKRRATYK
jgi:hypothetical protein